MVVVKRAAAQVRELEAVLEATPAVGWEDQALDASPLLPGRAAVQGGVHPGAAGSSAAPDRVERAFLL